MSNIPPQITEQLREEFLRRLPQIERYARHVFRRCRRQDREELVAESVARMWLFFVRMSQRGPDPRTVFGPLLRFCILAVKDDRRVGSRKNVQDLWSRAPRHGIRIHSLEERDNRSRSPWKEVIAETRNCSPADTAAARLDIEAWLRSESRPKRSLARLLAVGERTSDVAKRLRISPARVSQLRRELCDSWQRFQGSALEPRKKLAVGA